MAGTVLRNTANNTTRMRHNTRYSRVQGALTGTGVAPWDRGTPPTPNNMRLGSKIAPCGGISHYDYYITYLTND